MSDHLTRLLCSALAIVAVMGCFIGCAQQKPNAGPLTPIDSRTHTISSGDPDIVLENGETIRVEGIPDGESIQAKSVRYRDANGRELIKFDRDDTSQEK